MKRYLFFAAAVALAASCAKESPQVESNSNGHQTPDITGTEAVLFSTNLKANIETKASGSVEAWNKQNLYIYGLERFSDDNGKTVKPRFLEYTLLIKNKMAAAPASGESGKIDVNAKDAVVEQPTSEAEPYYYSGTKTYDFFGYYVDDAAGVAPAPTLNAKFPTTAGTDSAYVLPITINGGQDIMVAKADRRKSVKVAQSEIKAPADTLIKYAYSAWAARRGVHPILKFEHQLARVNFFVSSGTDFTGGAPQLYVDKVTFHDVNTAADLVVASDTSKVALGIHNEKTPANIDVTQTTSETDQTRIALKKVTVPSKEVDSPTAVGAPTMLFPAKEYKVSIVLSQNKVTQPVAPIEKVINISDVQIKVADKNKVEPGNPGYIETWGTLGQEEFEAGYSYNVYLKVYGLEKVDVTVELTPWKEGGKIDIDTDEKPAF